MIFHTAFPLRCCAKGGRKVFSSPDVPLCAVFLPYISPSTRFYFFSARCSWCATAPWQRMWSQGSRSSTRGGISRIRTTFYNNQDWQAGNRYVIAVFFFLFFFFLYLCFIFLYLCFIFFIFVFYLFMFHKVLIMKETLVFITPPQQHIETIMQNVRSLIFVHLC